MRHHSKDRERDEQSSPPRRPRLPALPKTAAGDQDPFQALFAFAYLQAQSQRRQAVEELRHDADCLSAVISAQHTLAVSDFDLQGKLDFIVEQARRISDAAGVVIALAEEDRIVCRARSGLVGPPLGARLDPHSGISGECIRTGEILYCDDTETDPRVDLDACRQLGIRSILAVPLIRNEQTLGLLEIFSGWAGVFSERDNRTLKLLAGQVIEALYTEELRWRQATAVVPEEIAPAFSSPQATTIATVEEPAVAPPAAAAPAMAVEAAAAASATPAPEIHFAFLEPETKGKTLAPRIIAGVAILALLLASFVWHQISRHGSRAVPAAPEVQAQEVPAQEPLSKLELPLPEVVPAADAVGPAQLIDIRHSSKSDYTAIAIFLNNAVKYASGTLQAPDRIYFDLKATTLAANSLPRNKEWSIDVNDRVVSRIRAAQKDDGITRVVLDLKSPAEFNTVLSSEAPYRLMISVHPRGTRPVIADEPASKPGAPPARSSAAQPAPELKPASAVLSGRQRLRIVIDPGHGGSEDGAIGPRGLKEKDLVLDVAHRLGTLLATQLDAEIHYTRTDDRNVGLEERTALANQLGADMFVSVHANSSADPNARGIETYYVDSASSLHEAEVAARENATSRKQSAQFFPPQRKASQEKIDRSRALAMMVQQALYRSLADGHPELRNRGVKRAPFVVLLDADMPSVLAEISFLSSPEDEHVLQAANARDTIADALFRGIATYLKGMPRGKAAVRSAAWGK